MATRLSPIDTWLLLNDQPLLFRDGYDNREIQARESYNFIKTTPQAPEALEIFICARGQRAKQGGLVELDDNPESRNWSWQPEGKAGLYELHVELPDHPDAIALIAVSLGPISQRHKTIMIADLRRMQDFLFLLGSPDTKEATLQLLEGDISPLREYEQITYTISMLRQIIADISHRPHSILLQSHQRLRIHEIRKFSNKVVPQWHNMLPHATSLVTTHPVEFLPETWMMTYARGTYDTYENRLLKRFIQNQLLPKLSFIRERASEEINIYHKERLKEIEREIQRCTRAREVKKVADLKQWIKDEAQMIARLNLVIAACQQKMQECHRWLDQSFLATAGPTTAPLQATQILLKNPLYHRFYRLYLEFQQTLALNLDTEHFLSKLSLRQMSGIYQVWSVFSLTRTLVTKLLHNDYQPLDPRRLFYEAKKHYFHFDVRGNVTAIILTKGPTRVEIKYEPRYLYHEDTGHTSGLVARSARLGLTPDMAIEVYKGGRFTQLIVFDAKHKSHDVGKYKKFLDADEESLWKYIRGIVYQDWYATGPKLREVPTIACILYPGNVLDWPPPHSPDPRALPLVPDMRSATTHDVDQAIEDILAIAGLTL